ncbi:hypothetical protein DM01DRAFT_1339694 [Hesseltinella vesiculosa]|uniref:Glycosyltransferase family 49 protein n=1 Tax=Hesseltinella vesiculosa TaxID=101127 RepID=A0A1X2G643_9FUNG|nr:hypothetical protein DM01DRAFT_1339694 [Hesseltinella vesiculosa]
MNWLDTQDQLHQMDLAVVQEKAFSASVGQHTIEPYYHKASQTPQDSDITITTTITKSRIDTLARLAARYQGPISATLHISSDESSLATLSALADAIDQSPAMQAHVDLHLVRDKMERQMNLWRNVARYYARSKYVMMLDVDFYLCTDFRQHLLGNAEALAKLEAGHALVVPAFEFTSQPDGLDYRTFPTDKSQLQALYQEKKIDMFHAFWRPGHDASDYAAWFLADDVYGVTQYQHSYEPYVIYQRDGHSWCDERFFGYGSNKAACLYEMFVSGVEFYVLPQDFIIHQTHDYPNETRDLERFYNRRLYTAFREELCFKYARQFISHGQWGSPTTQNLLQVCDKVPRFHSIIKTFL